MKFTTYAASIQGRRNYQEDRFLVDEDLNLFAVCDGVGGHPNGDLAAQTIVDTFTSIPVTKLEASPHQALMDAIYKADRECRSYYDERASTCTGIYIQDNKIYGIHAGDTRLSVYSRPADLYTQITQDHGQGRFLSNAVGFLFKTDIPQRDMKAGDVYVLTSDGVHDYLNIPGVIKTALNETDDPAEYLVNTAYENGSHDNCTAVVIVVED